jgi:hypothetical protein
VPGVLFANDGIGAAPRQYNAIPIIIYNYKFLTIVCQIFPSLRRL